MVILPSPRLISKVILPWQSNSACSSDRNPFQTQVWHDGFTWYFESYLTYITYISHASFILILPEICLFFLLPSYLNRTSLFYLPSVSSIWSQLMKISRLKKMTLLNNLSLTKYIVCFFQTILPMVECQDR